MEGSILVRVLYYYFFLMEDILYDIISVFRHNAVISQRLSYTFFKKKMNSKLWNEFYIVLFSVYGFFYSVFIVKSSSLFLDMETIRNIVFISTCIFIVYYVERYCKPSHCPFYFCMYKIPPYKDFIFF